MNHITICITISRRKRLRRRVRNRNESLCCFRLFFDQFSTRRYGRRTCVDIAQSNWMTKRSANDNCHFALFILTPSQVHLFAASVSPGEMHNENTNFSRLALCSVRAITARGTNIRNAFSKRFLVTNENWNASWYGFTYANEQKCFSFIKHGMHDLDQWSIQTHLCPSKNAFETR